MTDLDEIDADEVDDGREPDDEDDEDVGVRPPRVKPLRFVLERDGKTVETYLICGQRSVRTDSSETFANPDDAKQAYERIKHELLARGYKQS